MGGTWSAQGGRYIWARDPRYLPGACTGRSLRATVLEACVWAHGKARLSDPAVLRTPDAQGRGDPAVDVRAEQERGRLERKLAALDREVTRLVDAYQAEVIELTELAERRRRIEDHGRMHRNGYGKSLSNGASGAQSSDYWKGWTLVTSIREAMEEPSFRSSRRCDRE